MIEGGGACDNRRGWLTGHGPYFVGFVALIIDWRKRRGGCSSWLEVGDLLDWEGDLIELYCGFIKNNMQSVSCHDSGLFQ